MRKQLPVAFVATILDQASKYWAVKSGPHRVFSFFNVIITHNKGITFGLFQGIPQWFLWLVTGFILAFVLFELWQARTKYDKFAYSFILGGALGNIIDRLCYGYVIDFIDLHLGSAHYPWPFNLADAFIVCGVSLLIIPLIKKKA